MECRKPESLEVKNLRKTVFDLLENTKELPEKTQDLVGGYIIIFLNKEFKNAQHVENILENPNASFLSDLRQSLSSSNPKLPQDKIKEIENFITKDLAEIGQAPLEVKKVVLQEMSQARERQEAREAQQAK